MTRACPHCGGSGLAADLDNDEVLAMTKDLRDECDRRGIIVDWRGYVSAADAAPLINKRPERLANLRSEGRGPDHTGGNRPRYRLSDIAKYILNPN